MASRASELLLSIPEHRRRAVRGQIIDSSANGQAEAAFEEDEQDVLAAARSYGDAKEFMRASHLLDNCKSARGRFMRWYYDFLVCHRFKLSSILLCSWSCIIYSKAEEKRALRDWHNLDCECQLAITRHFLLLNFADSLSQNGM